MIDGSSLTKADLERIRDSGTLTEAVLATEILRLRQVRHIA